MRSAAGSRPRPRAREAAARLAAAGIDTPQLDAELLLAHALGVDRAALLLHPDRELTAAEDDAFAALVRRREAREPVAYLLGTKGFRRIELAVDRRVLVPRPETELLVEAALDLPRGARVADVGTGSGAVALALKDERPDLDVVATDSSEDALAVARANAERLGLDVAFARGELLDPISGRLDAVLSNPPYVADGDPLPPDVADFEPAAALYAGPDGLAVVRRLLAQAAERTPFLAIEVGAGQAPAVAELAREAGFESTDTRPDLAGIDRVVIAHRKGARPLSVTPCHVDRTLP
jgi:release factor glutamine methyltransferase